MFSTDTHMGIFIIQIYDDFTIASFMRNLEKLRVLPFFILSKKKSNFLLEFLSVLKFKTKSLNFLTIEIFIRQLTDNA